MKYLRCAGALALLLVLLLALPALAEGAARMDETSDTFCGATGGEHQIADDAWVVSVEPSCVVGLRKGLCEACGLTYLETIPATGEHAWLDGEVTRAATCSAEGEMTYACEMCGALIPLERYEG